MRSNRLANFARAGLLSAADEADYKEEAENWENDLEQVLREALNVPVETDPLRDQFQMLGERLRQTISRDGSYTIRIERSNRGLDAETLEAPPPA